MKIECQDGIRESRPRSLGGRKLRLRLSLFESSEMELGHYTFYSEAIKHGRTSFEQGVEAKLQTLLSLGLGFIIYKAKAGMVTPQ
jgi:hypothetical protein